MSCWWRPIRRAIPGRAGSADGRGMTAWSRRWMTMPTDDDDAMAMTEEEDGVHEHRDRV